MDDKSAIGTESEKRKRTYKNLFRPDSIVVVGASSNPLKPGGRVFKNIKDHDYKGELWAVNPTSKNIQGMPTFESIADLPHGPDLAIVAVSSKFILDTLQALADKKTGAVIILTAGFGEKDAKGKETEQEMLKIGAAADMDLIGPNCSGFLTRSYKGKFAGIIPELPGGAVDIISGSGATVDYVMEQANLRGISFGTVINLGNSIQYGVEDLLQMYDEHYSEEDARVLLIYMESVKKPDILLKHARSLIKKGCSIVGIKSGTTPAGEKAAASHTGAMASSDTAVQALFEKAGIIRVRSKIELIDTACALVACGGMLPGRRICVITDAGGPGVMMTDRLFRQGVNMARFKDSTMERLAEILPPEAAYANPIDCLPTRNAELIEQLIKVLSEEESENVDAIAVLTGNSGMSDNAPIYSAIADAMKKSPIPVLPVLSSLTTAAEKIENFRSAGNVYFHDEATLADALANISGRTRIESGLSDLAGYDRQAVKSVLEGKKGVLSPDDVDNVLKAAGFKVAPQKTVKEKADLSAACDAVGFPMAVKVVGPLHKSDVGGVKVGVADLAEAESVFDDMMKIKDAEGIMLQSMISGTEMILGANLEQGYGHLIMFGLGGIYTEVLKDVCFALAPLTEPESIEMVKGIKSFPILEGIRGSEAVDIEHAAENLQRLGMLVSDFPQIKEMDINPLKGAGEKLYAVDARIILDQ
ncbi:MAG: acetate--CoA ligase family protein [Desulfobacteraceae bacterium]|nr:acetate--CoA ligase family protein [Desulfobacteraceae bacterium]MCF8095201.1 acetate--CoA ligase family protein [Desulfobacteraceae bacterium]